MKLSPTTKMVGIGIIGAAAGYYLHKPNCQVPGTQTANAATTSGTPAAAKPTNPIANFFSKLSGTKI